MRKIILASHHLMAEGLKDTLQYIGSSLDHIEAVCAYMDNIPVEQQLKNAIGKIDKNDEYIGFVSNSGVLLLNLLDKPNKLFVISPNGEKCTLNLEKVESNDHKIMEIECNE